MEIMRLIIQFLTGRRTAWIALVLALTAAGAGFALLPGQSSQGYPQSGLPDDAQSAQVAAILQTFPGADATAGLLVYSRGGDEQLTSADRTAIEAAAGRLAEVSLVPQATAPRYSDNATVALVTVPLDGNTARGDIEATATNLRELARADLPAGLTAVLTGPVGFQADVANSFAGADTRLLLITVAVVAVLLIVTYRSPVLWLVPLAVVATGDGLARQIVGSLGTWADVQIDASIMGILSVLVFGAGTNYALLLVARYREELVRTADHHAAMATALRNTAPAILASGGTVTLSLATLVLATLGSNRTLGWACAVGIITAMAAALLILPSALVVCGRKVFWPFVPRFVPDAAPHLGWWGRLGQRVARHPGRFVALPTVGLAVLALGLTGLGIGLSQSEQFVGEPESVVGQETVDNAFAAGSTAPTVVVVPVAGAAEAQRIAQETPGVAAATTTTSTNEWAQLSLTLEAEPASDGAYDAIRSLRAAYEAASAPVNQALVGGPDATSLDELTVAAADQRLIMPIILGVVFLILVLLLRSLVAPVLLIVTVLATFAASLGAGVFLFEHVFGYPALDTSVVLFAFLFLVALGVDYNIFLTTRAREERQTHGTRDGMVRALGATGGVITSAGILLAAVFAVLGVLPVVALMQIGVIVCIGVLLDTLVVRTLVVPALAFWLGDRFWWPARQVAVRED